MKRRKDEEEPEKKRDIIEEYHNFASRVYAGISREGLSIDKLSNKYEVQPISLTTYQGVQDLVQTIRPSQLETKINVKKLITKIEKNYTRLELNHKQVLKKAQEMLEGKKEQQEEIIRRDRKASVGFKLRPDTPNGEE